MSVTPLFTGAPLTANGLPGQVYTLTDSKAVLGQRCFGFDTTGNVAEYIFLAGVTSTIVGSVVTYDEAGLTTLIAANAVGPVAIATAIVDAATKGGWYGIAGTFLTDVVANCADNAKLGRETTDGKVGDGAASGDIITGAVSRAATTAAAVVLCQILYPSVNDSSA
jgi:hypothetical protein